MASFNYQGFFECLDQIDHLYKNKYAARAAVGIIKCLRKVDDIRESEITKTKEGFEKA
jgi:hypothetical protein